MSSAADAQKRRNLMIQIEELTEMLRGEHDFKALREALSRKSIDAASALLVWFCEDEELKNHGVVIDSRGTAYEYSRDNDGGWSNTFLSWNELPASRFDEFPSVAIALAMQADGSAP
jgi:hypothetical protein